MSKYLIDPKDRIEVSIFIDTSRNNKVLRNSCLLTQGRSPCRGNLNQPCFQRYANCNDEMKEIICMDDCGKLGENLPKEVIKETASWAKETWAISQAIEKESIIVNQMNGERSIDMSRLIQNKIKYLLRDWSLSKSDSELKIILIKSGKFDIIRQDVLDKIFEIEPNIINSLYAEYIKQAMGGEFDKKKDSRECSDSSGVKTKE